MKDTAQAHLYWLINFSFPLEARWYSSLAANSNVCTASRRLRELIVSTSLTVSDQINTVAELIVVMFVVSEAGYHQLLPEEEETNDRDSFFNSVSDRGLSHSNCQFRFCLPGQNDSDEYKQQILGFFKNEPCLYNHQVGSGKFCVPSLFQLAFIGRYSINLEIIDDNKVACNSRFLNSPLISRQWRRASGARGREFFWLL